jgi:hypothetical protein
MTLTIPRYLQEANIQSRTIRYEWDDWNTEQAEEPIDEDFYKQLQGLSQRACIAFAVGTAGWIVQRFRQLCTDPTPDQYLEAAWAKVVHECYGGITWEEYASEDQWIGPVNGPISRAMDSVQYVLQQAEEDGEPELGGAWITNLARYVMSEPLPYQRWRGSIIDRFSTLYSRNPEETLGEVVPMECLDPEANFQLEQTEALVNRFLASLDYKSNPFLNSPEKMLEEGFEGIPYIFNIVADRKARVDW